MRMNIGAQTHVNCFDPGFTCCATHLSWNRQPVDFPEFQSRIWRLKFYELYVLLFVYLVCTNCLIFEQVNKKILGRHEARGGFCCYATDEMCTLVQRINNYIS